MKNQSMKLVIVLSCVVVLASAFGKGGKIVGGHDTDIQEVPYQLSMQVWEIVTWSHTCGASIISENVAVTAAHCAVRRTASGTRLLSGSDQRGKGTHHAVESLTVHPDYDDSSTDHDVAVIVVKDPFQWADSVQPIPLVETEPKENDVAIVSGWGTLTSGGSLPKKLQSVEVPIVSRDVCRENYGVSSITDNMICAGLPQGGKDSCQGDSGGPLAVNGKLAGIVSWGYGCAEPGYPGVYTNVAALLDWINEKVQDAKLNK